MTAAPDGPQGNPFPGLRPFREDEAHLFFGRENQVDAMVDKLAETHFLAVIGSSGSGKSSLVNCGLRPALCQGLMARAGTVWRMAQFRPGNDPIGAMARALAEPGVLFEAGETGGLALVDVVETTLRMSKLGLIDICEQAALGEDVNVLVVVDQFEELFRYRQLTGAGTSAEDATAFVNLLLEVKSHPASRIHVVLTMRSDFLGDCTQFPGLAEAINAGQYLVPRLTRDERRAAIEGPVGVGGAQISRVLLTRLVNDVGDNPDQLSILQHALNRTWAYCREKTGAKGLLDLEHYEAIGTMDHALDQHADQAYAELTERHKQIAEKLFKALTDKASDARGVRRPTTVAVLCALADATSEEVAGVIEVFREPSRSFLMPPAGEPLAPETVIDISHESLMRVWRRLSDWADEESRSSRTYTNLAVAAEEHAADKRSLWRDPELQLALDWRENNQPNEAWASRYHQGFAAAQRFLTQSSDARDAERSERRRQRRRELAAEQEKAAIQARNVKRMGAATIFCAALAAAVGFFGWQAHQASETAKQKETEASDNLRESQIMQSRWLINVAEQNGDQSTRILLALEALPSAQELAAEGLPDGQGKKTRPLFNKAQTSLFGWLDNDRASTVVHGHDGPVNSVAMTADGSRIFSGSDDNTVRVWNAQGTETLLFARHSKPVRSIAVTPDGNHIVSGSDDQTVRLWDAGGAEVLQLPHPAPVRSVAITSDGRLIASGSADGIVRVWDGTKSAPPIELKGHRDAVNSVAITPDGSRIVSGSNDGSVRLWDVAKQRELRRFKRDAGAVNSVAITAGRRTIIVAAGSNGTVDVWDESGRRLAQAASHSGPLYAVALAGNATRIIAGSDDSTGRLLTIIGDNDRGSTTVEPLLQMNGHSGPVRSVAATEDGRRLVTASDDRTMRLWDRKIGTMSPDLGTPEALARLIVLASDAVPRCLTIDERLERALNVIPPDWCFEKNPYVTPSWAAWRAKQRGTIDANMANKRGGTIDADMAKHFGLLADEQLRSGDFRGALDLANLGLEFDPQQIWITINKAHALMFLDKLDEADKAYLKHPGSEVVMPGEPPFGKWEKVIVDDLDRLRGLGRCHPHMTDVAGKLGGRLKESTHCRPR